MNLRYREGAATLTRRRTSTPGCQASWPCRRIRRDAGAGKHDDANREDVEDLVVALERRGPRVTVPVGLEDDLRMRVSAQQAATRYYVSEEPTKDVLRLPRRERAMHRQMNDRLPSSVVTLNP